jgi:anion-transporting  ArsA/GET3 family ATPase
MRGGDSSPKPEAPGAGLGFQGRTVAAGHTILLMPDDRTSRPAHGALIERIEGRRVCVCMGPGGVGKTTVSAALGLGLAARGKRVLVVTIDPAKRLAGALGVGALPGEPHRVEAGMLDGSGLDGSRLDGSGFDGSGLAVDGEMWAMTLDVKGTFDGLVARLAPEESARRQILENRIYEELSSAVAGAQELSALFKLYELDQERDFDVIVLDTPPSRNALDFLAAPARLQRLLEGRVLNLFLTPGGLAARLFGRSSALLLSIFSRATGVDLIGELSEFFGSLTGTIDGVQDRANVVDALLRDPSATSFLIVTSPELEPTREAAFLAGSLVEAGMPGGGLIVNRVQLAGLGRHTAARVRALLAPQIGERLAGRVAGNLADFDVLARRDQRNVAELSEAIGEAAPIVIPDLGQDIHDLTGLAAIVEHLFA